MWNKECMKLFKLLVAGTVFILFLFTAYQIFYGPQRQFLRKQQQGNKNAITSAEDFRVRPLLPDLPPLQEGDDRQGERRIALIIDDIGFNLGPLKELLEIDAPLAFAVLPYASHAAAAAELIHERGREIMLHLPMEPQDGKQDPGPGALFRAMPEVEIRRRMSDDLAAVPYIVGVNNHMGSAFMEDEGKLHIVLKELQSRGLFFIDSRTTPASRAEILAERLGIRFAARWLFLDNDPEQALIFSNLFAHLEKTKRTDMVIIGHPYPSTIEALKKAVPLLQSRGFRIVPPSKIVEQKAVPNQQE